MLINNPKRVKTKSHVEKNSPSSTIKRGSCVSVCLSVCVSVCNKFVIGREHGYDPSLVRRRYSLETSLWCHSLGQTGATNIQDLPREAQGQDLVFRPPPWSTLPRRYSSAPVTLSGTARTKSFHIFCGICGHHKDFALNLFLHCCVHALPRVAFSPRSSVQRSIQVTWCLSEEFLSWVVHRPGEEKLR